MDGPTGFTFFDPPSKHGTLKVSVMLTLRSAERQCPVLRSFGLAVSSVYKIRRMQCACVHVSTHTVHVIVQFV